MYLVLNSTVQSTDGWTIAPQSTGPQSTVTANDPNERTNERTNCCHAAFSHTSTPPNDAHSLQGLTARCLMFTKRSNVKDNVECYSLFKTTPAVKDPRELHTIVANCLRSSFGDCHGHMFHIIECHPSKDDSKSYLAVIKASRSSMEYVRASLCFVQAPSHLQEHIYRIDFIKVVPSLDDLQS